MIELRDGERVEKTWPDADLEPALRAWWRAIGGTPWDPESSARRWTLLIPGRPPVRLDRATVTERQVLALGERQPERRFLEEALRRHLSMLDTFDLAHILSIPSDGGGVAKVVEAVRAALSCETPLTHLGKLGDSLARPPGATFTLTTRSGVFANGAGTMTHVSEWALDLYAPFRLALWQEETSEEGMSSTSLTVTHRPGAAVEPLLDALKERGLSPEAKVAPLTDA